jgi:glycogen phosphorylase
VHLGALSPSDVRVQVVYGRTHETDVLLDTQSIDLDPVDAPEGDTVEFTGTLPLTRAGSFGYNVRIVPQHPMLASVAEMGLVAFGQ